MEQENITKPLIPDRPGMQKGLVTQDSQGRFTGVKGLSEKRKAFVHYFIKNGGDIEEAEKSAGIAKAYGYYLLKQADVQQALQIERETAIGNLATLALKTVHDILTNKDAPFGVRASLAVKMIDYKHAPEAVELDRLKDRRIDEMSADELAEHARLLDKALADCGVLIDVTPSTGAQPAEIQATSLSRQDSATPLAPPAPPPPASAESVEPPLLKFFTEETEG